MTEETRLALSVFAKETVMAIGDLTSSNEELSLTKKEAMKSLRKAQEGLLDALDKEKCQDEPEKLPEPPDGYEIFSHPGNVSDITVMKGVMFWRDGNGPARWARTAQQKNWYQDTIYARRKAPAQENVS